MVTTADPTHFTGHLPPPSTRCLPACPTSMSAGGWRVCSIHPLLQYQQQPPTSLSHCCCHRSQRSSSHATGNRKLLRGYLWGIPRSRVKLSKDSYNLPLNAPPLTTLWLQDSPKTKTHLFVTQPTALFHSLPLISSILPHPIIWTRIVVISFFSFPLIFSSLPSLCYLQLPFTLNNSHPNTPLPSSC